MKMSKIFLGALVVGTLDIVFAMTYWRLAAGTPPSRIFQSVAAGLLGRDAARQGGMPTVLLGAVCHYFISFMVVLVYALASRRLPILTRRPIELGALYGIGVWLVMTFIVVPLSAAEGGQPFRFSLWVTCSILAHIILIGIPAAIFARKAVTIA